MTVKSTGYRLNEGGLIDRTRTLRFKFNGEALSGYYGDTLASALIANGISLIGRSFKYHRPRGFFGAGLEDPNSMMAVRDAYGYDPAIRAGQVLLTEGLDARSVSGSPSPGFDLGAVAQLASGILAAGFYYKTFKWPSWRVFEPIFCHATGFGRPQGNPDGREGERRHANCDVLVIGGGPAGLTTARALRGTGLSVVIADDQPTFGGSLLWETAELGAQSAVAFSRMVAAELESDADCTLLTSTLVTGAYEDNVFTLVQALRNARGVFCERHWILKARHVVLATGMIDRPLLFEGNDRPGIMLSSSVRRLIGEFAVAPARRLVIYTNNDSAYLTAIIARRAGMEVTALIDTRPEKSAIHAEEATRLGVACYFESQIETTFGYRRLSGVAARGRNGEKHQFVCDGLASSGGWTPLIHLAAHRGVKPSYDEQRALFICRDLPAGWLAVGGANGALDLDTVMREAGQAARALSAARHSAPPRDAASERAHSTMVASGVEVSDETASTERVAKPSSAPQTKAASFGTMIPLWIPRFGSRKRMWVDLQNDVKVSDIELAAHENYTSIEHLKRYTTLGMGTDQGRTSNVNGLGVLAALTGKEIGTVGSTTFRPPYTAVRMATIASDRRGDLYRPRRYLPADVIHRELGAVMEDFGWERPDWYRSNGGEREVAVAAEMRAVREQVGVFDASSLGKIEVTGSDAGKFLAKFYVSNMATLKPGRIRYSVMLREDGVIFDDGVVTCIAPNHYLSSPTSGNAEYVAAWFERWRQTEWPALRVAISPVTENWAAISIAGPKARELLQRLEPDFDISGKNFPHMEFREGSLGGVRARVSRISFTGELQYEITVPARYGATLMETLAAAAADLAPRPVGMEAWLRLRLEKGYVHVGSDTNGRTTPLDIGMASIVAKREDDFIGKRSLSLPFATSGEREQLVGLTALDGTLQVGGRILAAGYARVPCPTEGCVTSACCSPSLGRSIGLALLERGHQREEETVLVYSASGVVRCRVCNPTFYDPKNERSHP
jgi:sarcosine oxidase, subunit alpha